MAKCPQCGSEDGCQPKDFPVSMYDLDPEQWLRLYMFMKYVYLPFMHGLISETSEKGAE